MRLLLSLLLQVPYTTEPATWGDVGLGLLMMAVIVAGWIGIVSLLDQIRNWFCAGPRLSKRDIWCLYQIRKGRMDARTAAAIVPSEADLKLMAAEIKKDAEDAETVAASASASPPAASEGLEDPPPAPTRVIELVASAHTLNTQPPSLAFLAVIADHSEWLRGLVREGYFDKIDENFRREEERTHYSIKCACAVAEAMLDAIKDIYLPGRRVCRIAPELGEDGENGYRCVFMLETSTGRRPLQISQEQTIEPALEPTLACPGNVLKIQFQDGEEIELRSDLEFVGLSEQDFNIAYKAFEATRAALFGQANPPALNSRAQKDWDQTMEGNE
jgi:hypothetical protein